MKTGIHPQVYDVVFIDTSTGDQFITTSTQKSDEKMTIDGKEYFVIKVEISSKSHPFYTGKQKLIDTAGRVDKFRAKMAKIEKKAEAKKDEVKDEPVEQKEEPKAEEAAVAAEPEEVKEETAEAPKEEKEKTEEAKAEEESQEESEKAE
jgi:large subunit ribosomal protein L31